jgi:hypothetical protein
VRQLALLFLASTVGCFYVETINQRPSIEIENKTPGVPARGGTFVFHAVKNDPEDPPDAVDVAWEAHACISTLEFSSCDQTAFLTGTQDDFTFTAPLERKEPDGQGILQPVQAVWVILTATDSHGARARPDQVLPLALQDAVPTIAQLSVAKGFGANGGHVIGTTVDITADYFDTDDNLDQLVLDWKAFSPTQTMFALQDLGTKPGTIDGHRQSTVRLLPPVTGDWMVTLSISDTTNNVGSDHATITVIPDAPPCLAQLTPIVPGPTDQALPITQPTLFEVPLVTDDLDRYPPPANPQLGTTRFEWSILPPGGTRTVITGASGNSVAFDPATYLPGSRVELRVEIFDRKNTSITCADMLPTCSVNASPCLQRQTWRLEVQ